MHGGLPPATVSHMKWTPAKFLWLVAAVLWAVGAINAGTSLDWAPAMVWLLGGLSAAALATVLAALP